MLVKYVLGEREREIRLGVIERGEVGALVKSRVPAPSADEIWLNSRLDSLFIRESHLASPPDPAEGSV